MNRKKKGICVLILGVICLTTLGARKIVYTSTVHKMFTESVWLENGKYDPENNGKQVTILLNSEETKEAYDPELELRFKVPVVRRKVEVFSYVGENKDGEPEWKWKDTAYTAEKEPEYRIISGEKEILEIDRSFDELFSAGRELTMDDLTDETRITGRDRFENVIQNGKVYFTDAPSICFRENCRGTSYLEYEGCLRLNYTSLVTGGKAIAVTGFQQEKRLIPDRKLKGTAVLDMKIKEK